MNYIRQQLAFYQQIEKDPFMKALHISLYHALFQVWNAQRFPEVFRLNRTALMQKSRIGSKTTFAKTLIELHAFGYISCTTRKVSMNLFSPEIVPASVPKVGNIDNQTENDKLKENYINIYPSEEEAKNWFAQKRESVEMALTFFYHYSANGWMTGGHPMKNWKAAAGKWIFITKRMTPHGKTTNVYVNKNKDYSEPL